MSFDTVALYFIAGIVYIITLVYSLLKRNYSLIYHISLIGFFIAITLFIGYWFFPLDILLDSASRAYIESFKPFKAGLTPFVELFFMKPGSEMLYVRGIIVNLGLPMVSCYCISMIKHRRKPLRSVVVTGIILVGICVLGFYNYYLWTSETLGYDTAYLLFNVLGVVAGYWLFKATIKALQTMKKGA